MVRRQGHYYSLDNRRLAVFRLLEFLLNNAGQIVTRTMLLEGVWGFHFDPATSIVETHISRLRSKLDDGFDQSAIRTVRGAGYIIDG